MKFKLDLFGTKCNEYPRLTVLHNQQIIYSGLIVESVVLDFDIDLQENTTLTLQGIDKKQEKNGKWDTQIDNAGLIIADKSLCINNIWFNDIPMGQEWIRSLVLINGKDNEKFSAAGWWKNGSISFSIELPLLDWIINEKFIKVEQNIVASHDARSGEQKFDYQYIQKKIKIIRKIIND